MLLNFVLGLEHRHSLHVAYGVQTNDFFFGTRSFKHIEIISQRHTLVYFKRRQTRVFFVMHIAGAVGVGVVVVTI